MLQQPSHTINNAKAIQIEEDRLLEIEARNRALYARMCKIDKKPLQMPEGRAVLTGYMRSNLKNIESIERENQKMLMRL